MVKQPEGEWVVPNPQIPRTFGMLNIIFGILTLLFATYSVVAYFYAPKLQDAMAEGIKKQEATAKAEREAKIAELKRKEAAAKSEDEKETLEREREALEIRVEPDMTAMADMMNIYRDKRVKVFFYAEVVASVILNVLMIIAGIGLLRLTEWGRRLSIAVAWLKILRWLAITAVTMILIVPLTLEKSKPMFDSIGAQVKATGGARATPFPVAALAQFTAIATAVSAVFSALFASIYPGFSIWFLTRARARAACLQHSKPELPPGVPEFGET
jgi:hypothetical protein